MVLLPRRPFDRGLSHHTQCTCGHAFSFWDSQYISEAGSRCSCITLAVCVLRKWQGETRANCRGLATKTGQKQVPAAVWAFQTSEPSAAKVEGGAGEPTTMQQAVAAVRPKCIWIGER